MNKPKSVLFTLCVLLVGSCGAKYQTLPSDAPAWVVKCSGAFLSDAGKFLYGCGGASVDAYPDYTMRRRVAENRARVDLGSQLNQRMGSLSKDYQASVAASKAASPESFNQITQRVSSQVQQDGIQIVDSYENPKDGAIWALARLDTALVKNGLLSANGLTKEMREYVEQKADEAFRELDAEIEKRGR